MADKLIRIKAVRTPKGVRMTGIYSSKSGRRYEKEIAPMQAELPLGKALAKVVSDAGGKPSDRPEKQTA